MEGQCVYVAWFAPFVIQSLAVLKEFVEKECIPAEAVFERELAASGKRWGYVPPVVEALKARAKALGLWNAFLLKEDQAHVPAGAPKCVRETPYYCVAIGCRYVGCW